MSISIQRIAFRMCFAMFAGAMLGIEREYKNQPAGFRTYMLVCIGSALIMLTNEYLCVQYGSGDPARLGAQVINGIGFLGAGTIIHTRNNIVKGLTTAAGLWVSAALGLAIGIGFYEAATIGLVLIFFIMTVMRYWDGLIKRKSKLVNVYVEYDDSLQIQSMIDVIRTMDGQMLEIFDESKKGRVLGVRSMSFTLKLKKRKEHEELIMALSYVPGILYAIEI